MGAPGELQDGGLELSSFPHTLTLQGRERDGRLNY